MSALASSLAFRLGCKLISKCGKYLLWCNWLLDQKTPIKPPPPPPPPLRQKVIEKGHVCLLTGISKILMYIYGMLFINQPHLDYVQNPMP